jgi:SH3 domain protein
MKKSIFLIAPLLLVTLQAQAIQDPETRRRLQERMGNYTRQATTAPKPAPDKPAIQKPTHWITDRVLVNVHTGPGEQHAPLGQLRPGQPLSVTGRQGDWYKVLVNGKTGFVNGQYVTTEQPESAPYPYIRVSAEALENADDNLLIAFDAIKAENERLVDENDKMRAGILQLKHENTQIMQISGSKIDIARKNERLRELNVQMGEEIDDLRASVERLSDRTDQTWFLYGGLAVLAGVLIGWIGPMLRRHKPNSGW